jgi:hypothetical protein
MPSAELNNPDPERLPAVTEEVFTRLESKGFNSIEAVRLMEESDPLASESLSTYINGIADTTSEKVVAYRAAAYLYTMLHEAHNTEHQS